MPFQVDNFDESLELLVAAASGRFPLHNLAKHGGFNKRLRVVALGLVAASYNLRQAQLDVMADTASGDFLERIGAIWGVPRKGAVGSAGQAVYRVFGTAAAAVPINEPLTHAPSGLRFETRSSGVINASGFLDVDLAADPSTGIATNLEEDQELQFDATPLSLEQSGRILFDLEGGIDLESDADYRVRILKRIGEPELGGARGDFEAWVLAAAALVASAYVYPHRNGPGTVDLVALKSGSGTARLLDAGERSTILAAVELLRPVTATIRVLEVTGEPTDVDFRVLPQNDPSLVFDWDDSTAPTIASYVPSTRLLTFQAARPISMAPDDRISVDDPLSDGSEFEIEALSGSDAVILKLDLGYAPTTASKVYSGGPLVEPGRTAILELFDSLGPSNPDASSYGPWEGNLRTASLFEAVQNTPGVLDSDAVAPVATVEASDPPYPGNVTVGLLIPRKTIVRRWHV